MPTPSIVSCILTSERGVDRPLKNSEHHCVRLVPNTGGIVAIITRLETYAQQKRRAQLYAAAEEMYETLKYIQLSASFTGGYTRTTLNKLNDVLDKLKE